jgi:hypothetical protein
MLSEDDEPRWVLGTVSITVKQPMERFRQNKMNLNELTPPGWGDAADTFRERDEKYGSTELVFAAVGKPHRDDEAANPAPTTLREFK